VPGNEAAARLIAGGAATVALSVLADSGLEHYRGSFRNPAMVLPLIASAGELALGGAGVGGVPALRATVHAASVAIGTLGLGFHLFNVDKRPGGLTFTNLFYGAPLGAPAALILAGAFGAAGDAVAAGQDAGPLKLGNGRVLAGLAAIGIAGTVAEAALLHFRGAFHNPLMWVPVALPPLAAASLLVDASSGRPNPAGPALLTATAGIGVLGAAIHAWAISREMGGWRNWKQNILAGPPIPAPPSFTGLAIAAIGASMLMTPRDA
jgi:hypothetical protein